MFRNLQVFYSLFSGLLVALAIPNELYLLGSPVIALFSLVPLYIAVSQTKTYRKAFLLFFIHGVTIHLLSSFWLGYFKDFAIFTLGASDIGSGVYEGLCGLLIYFPFRHSDKSSHLQESSGRLPFFLPLRIIWFAALYTLWEYFKSTGFLAYPWGTLSMTAYTWPLLTQSAAIAGPYAVSFMIALFSSLTGEGILTLKKARHIKYAEPVFHSWLVTFKFTCALFSLAVIYGACEYTLARPVQKKLNAVLVQQNLDPWDGGDYEAIEISQRLSEREIDAIREMNAHPDLVVWSEGVLTKKFPRSMMRYRTIPYDEPLTDFINRMNVPFIIGAPVTVDAKGEKSSNCAVLFDKNGDFRGYYAKMHLVPFAELVPGVEYEWVRRTIKKIAGFSRGWTPGDKYTLFEIPISPEQVYTKSDRKIYSLCDNIAFTKEPSVLVSVPICFDDAFGEVCRGLFLAGSEVFVNITNDSWSLTKSAEYQHFVVAHYRAIEYRTTLVRSTNGGVTCIIDPAGKVLKSLPLFEEAAMSAGIPVYKREMTTYVRFGNWLPSCIIFAAALLIFLFRRREMEEEKRGISINCIYYTFEQVEFLELWPLDWSEWNW